MGVIITSKKPLNVYQRMKYDFTPTQTVSIRSYKKHQTNQRKYNEFYLQLYYSIPLDTSD